MSARKRIRIISNGTAESTRVIDAAGDPIKWGASGLIKLEIAPITAEGIVTAVLTVGLVALDVDADTGP